MKNIKFILIILFALSPSLGCSSNQFIQAQNWDFVQSVGGIKIGEPYLDNDIWKLPINCDVSGLREITTKPTGINSILVCFKVRVEIKSTKIYLTVTTSVPDETHKKAACCSAMLGKLSSGEYEVFYKGPDDITSKIGKISINPPSPSGRPAGPSR